MKTLTNDQIREILAVAKNGETHVVESKKTWAAGTRNSINEAYVFLVDGNYHTENHAHSEWVIMGVNGWTVKYNLAELRAQLEDSESSAEWIEGDICKISEYSGDWVYGCDVPTTDLCVVFKIASGSFMTIPKVRLSTPAELATKAKEDLISTVFEKLITNGFACDPLLLKCLFEHGYLSEKDTK